MWVVFLIRNDFGAEKLETGGWKLETGDWILVIQIFSGKVYCNTGKT
jgi:hypothetical protein